MGVHRRSGRGLVAPEAEWSRLVQRCRALVPEAFSSEGRPLNLIEGDWGFPAIPHPYTWPVDGSVLGELPMLEAEDAARGALHGQRVVCLGRH